MEASIVAMSMPRVVMNNAAQRWVSLACVGAAPAGAAARDVSGLIRSVMSARRCGGAASVAGSSSSLPNGPARKGPDPLW